MFTCNNLSLLTFTYYLKLFLGISMTIIPLIYFEKILIKIIKCKEKKEKITINFFKQQTKSFMVIIMIFVLALALHNGLNKKTNVCYNYANSYVLKEYKKVYKMLNEKNLAEDIKSNYLENTLIIAVNNPSKEEKKELTKVEKLISSAINSEENSKEENKDTLNLQETDYNKQNNVYVENGVFYYPQLINGNWSTYSGTSCPNNPSLEGYNNPYGYNNYFYTRLTAFIKEANANGFTITFSTQGCRTYHTQTYYYNTMTRGRAAYPGYSLHGFGIASDLEFYQSNGYACGYGRNDSNCPSMGWAHQNASRFGLTFPLLNASYKEDWHIEPINKVKY